MSSVRITSIVAIAISLDVRGRVRNEREMPGALDGGGQAALVPGAVAADAAGNDLRKEVRGFVMIDASK